MTRGAGWGSGTLAEVKRGERWSRLVFSFLFHSYSTREERTGCLSLCFDETEEDWETVFHHYFAILNSFHVRFHSSWGQILYVNSREIK